MVQAAVLVIYLGVALGGQAPNCPRGYNGPGGYANDNNFPDCTGGKVFLLPTYNILHGIIQLAVSLIFSLSFHLSSLMFQAFTVTLMSTFLD